MEDTLEVYKQPYDPLRPVVCMDESSKQQVKEICNPIPAEPGQPERYDTQYERNGVSNLFIFFEPLAGWRHVEVTDKRTAVDWAYQVRDLVDIHYPQAEKVKLVMDNLNTHTGASLYKAFEPQEARRILERLEIHYTPKHGSWLNMAEIELSILSRQCLVGTHKLFPIKTHRYNRIKLLFFIQILLLLNYNNFKKELNYSYSFVIIVTKCNTYSQLQHYEKTKSQYRPAKKRNPFQMYFNDG